MLLCIPLSRNLPKTPLRVATAAPTTVLALVATRVTEGDVVTAVHLRLELQALPHLGSFLLGNSNSSTQPGNHGVGLHHHGLRHRVRIPPLSGHTLPVLLSSQAF